MTCVIGLVDKLNALVLMGADGLDSGDSGVRLPSEPKVWVSGKYIMGHAGDSRACQVMKHGFTPPNFGVAPDDDPMGFMVTTFFPELVAALTQAGLDLKAVDDKTGNRRVEYAMLVGVSGRLFELDDGGAVYEHDRLAAIGSGSKYALGCIEGMQVVCRMLSHPLDAHKGDSITQIDSALMVAEKYNAYVGMKRTILIGGHR
jgi:hypothetical protein